MVERPSYRIAAWLFVRLLALVYLIAFVSLWTQVEGLIGSGGILPAGDFLERVSAVTGIERYWLAPTLGWLGAGDRALAVFCGLGALASLLVAAGWARLPGLVAMWALYLSLVTLGQDFLGFQWDVLLLEAGLLAIFLPGARLQPSGPLAVRPPRLAVWLLQLLVLKLMLASGVVKLTSGDPTWRNLTALRYHFETQPIPNPLAWLAHQLPGMLLSAATAVMFAIELLAPLLILGPPRLRRAAAGILAFLQVAILVSGNYAFFNLLGLVLLVVLLDDAWWLRFWRLVEPAAERRALGAVRRAVLVPLAVVWLVVSATALAGALRVPVSWSPLAALRSWTAPWRSINGYGLFAVMTTRRPEIVVEGSDDGVEWRAYAFEWKPGELTRMPPVVAPHQPRLDWQMWFAALRDVRASPWFVAFLERLAEARPEVLELLEHDPFDGRPPVFLRARLYDYRFTGFTELRRTGAWWQREELGIYFPAVRSEQLLAEPPRAP